MALKSALLALLPRNWQRWDSPPRRAVRELKGRVERAVPAGLRPPGSYYYRRVIGSLDPELLALLEHIRPGSVALDIGANIGVCSYAMLRRAGAVHAFEPHPTCVSVLRALAARQPRLSVHDVALSDAEGSLRFYVPVVDGREVTEATSLQPIEAPSRTIEAAVRSVDSFDFRDVSVIKIDVEGHEDAVLRGAENTLRREHPVLVIELEERHRSRPIGETVAWLASRGYRGFWFDDLRTRQPAETFSVERQQRAYLHDVTDARYVNNFLFLPNSAG